MAATFVKGLLDGLHGEKPVGYDEVGREDGRIAVVHHEADGQAAGEDRPLGPGGQLDLGAELEEAGQEDGGAVWHVEVESLDSRVAKKQSRR